MITAEDIVKAIDVCVRKSAELTAEGERLGAAQRIMQSRRTHVHGAVLLQAAHILMAYGCNTEEDQ